MANNRGGKRGGAVDKKVIDTLGGRLKNSRGKIGWRKIGNASFGDEDIAVSRGWNREIVVRKIEVGIGNFGVEP